MRRAVLLAGGWAHPGQDLIASMKDLLEPRGFEVVVETDPSQVDSTLAGGCDLLVVGSCWFAMSDKRYTSNQRMDHAVTFGVELEQALAGLVAARCPVLALHTAVICFDGAALWANWLGGNWNWATSWHPEPGPMRVIASANTPIAFESFSIIDELYQGLDVRDTTTMVAQSENGDPLVWLHESPGRAAVNLLGHDHRSLADPAHAQLNGLLVDWLLEASG